MGAGHGRNSCLSSEDFYSEASLVQASAWPAQGAGFLPGSWEWYFLPSSHTEPNLCLGPRAGTATVLPEA